MQMMCNKHSLGEGSLIVLDLLPRELVELGVDVDHPVGVLHLLAVLQRVVNLLSAVQDGEELCVS